MVKVKPTANQGRITVQSDNDTTIFSIKDNLSEYYAKQAENWAHSEGIVNGIDYSSKYYAEKSKESANKAEIHKNNTIEAINGFDENVQVAKDDIEQSRINSINTINSTYSVAMWDMQEKSDEVLTSIESLKVEAVDSINSTKTTILNDIEFIAEGEKEEIQELAEKAKDDIESTGFYMRDDKLYFINSEGEEQEFKSGGGGLEIGDIGFTQMAIDESKGKRRILNGQLIIQDQYVQFTNIIKESVALNPSLACTEAEWQTEVTMSTNGVCEKFVIDYEAGTIRLPKYPQYLDLTNNTGAKTQTVSVVGNGKAVTWTNGTSEGTFSTSHNSNYICHSSATNLNVGATASHSAWSPDLKAIGVTTDPTKSGLTGSVSIPAVQSEKIKGTYFIQVATGAETEDNIINEIELNNPFSLLDYKWSDYELNNLSWLHSAGQYNSKAVYPAVYDLLLKIYNGTETKAGVSVKLNTEGYTNYDFVLNTAEETFRLPTAVKQTFFNGINGNFPVIGNGMTLGLTEGTINCGVTIVNSDEVRFQKNAYGTNIGTVCSKSYPNSSDFTCYGVTTDPTKSGLVAKVSQSAVSGLYLYFYVGETVQNANLINAGRIEEKVADIRAELPHKLNDNQITNCLLEVPQRIKYTLEGGTLTIKAGTQVIVPNGFEADGVTPKFEYYTLETDRREDTDFGYDGKHFLCYMPSTAIFFNPQIEMCFSGNTKPTSSQYMLWYDTANNKIKWSDDYGASWTGYPISFPVLTGYLSAIKVWTSIDQVFNGMGYIGSTQWFDKGIKFLAPNGRNEDGTLNNIECITDRVVQNIYNYTTTNQYVLLVKRGTDCFAHRVARYFIQETEPTPQTHSIWYNPKTNLLKVIVGNLTPWLTLEEFFGDGASAIIIASNMTTDSNYNITNMVVKQPFRAVDYNEAVLKSSVDWSKKVNKTVSTTYTAESNGYVIACASPSGNNSLTCTVNGKNVMSLSMHGLSGVSYGQGFTIPVAKGDTYNVVGANIYYYFLPFKEV